MRKHSSILLTILWGVSLLCGCHKTSDKAKYIFLLIGDGMGTAHIAATESYLSYKQGKLGGEKLIFSEFPHYGIATTYSASDHITCSSAAGTAIACGEKAINWTIGINKDSVEIKSIAYELKEHGYGIGIVTNVPLNHATPSAFYAHHDNRDMYYEVSQQIADSGFDLFAGAGFIDFRDKDGDKMPTDQYLEEHGYTVCYGVDEFRAEAAGKNKVIFCQESNRETSADNYNGEAKKTVDTPLAQMLELSIEHLGEKNPFFIMCEGGTIDWSAHLNRTMAMVTNVLEFEEAVKTAYEFYLKHPDETLIVVTADHETGGLTLGCGPYEILWEKLEKQWIESGKRNILSKEENREFNKECSIGWTTKNHTGGHVPVFAIGKGAEKFCGRMDNTDIKGKILGE